MKKIQVLLSLVVLVLSSMLGLTSKVYADNVTDEFFAFYNTNVSGNTSGCYKSTPFDVYVHLITGPSLLCTVQGYNGTWNNRSETVCLIAGTQVSISNCVYQNGEALVRLHLERTVFTYSYSQGMWSPDPLPENYIIYG